MPDELVILQLVRLRGRATVEDVADSAGLASEDVQADFDRLAERGMLQDSRGRVRLTEAGRSELSTLLEAERAVVDRAALSGAYNEFHSFNDDFKQLVTEWQLRGPDTPNDHSDPDYDSRIIARLNDIHSSFQPLLGRLVLLAPRLRMYPRRFDAALQKVNAGDHTWIARPLVDSYHTGWFELHEDLINLCGRTRAREAAAGRAQ